MEAAQAAQKLAVRLAAIQCLASGLESATDDLLRQHLRPDDVLIQEADRVNAELANMTGDHEPLVIVRRLVASDLDGLIVQLPSDLALEVRTLMLRWREHVEFAGQAAVGCLADGREDVAKHMLQSCFAEANRECDFHRLSAKLRVWADMQTEGPPPGGDAEIVLDELGEQLLTRLGQNPSVAVKREDLAAACKSHRDTIKPRVDYLLAHNLAVKNGERGGIAISKLGLAFLNSRKTALVRR